MDVKSNRRALLADLPERIRIIRSLDFTVVARKVLQITLLLRSHIDASRAEIRRITLHRLALARKPVVRFA